MTFCWNLKVASIRNLSSSISIAEEFVAYTALPVFYVTSLCTCSIFLRMRSECVRLQFIILIYFYYGMTDRAFFCGIAMLHTCRVNVFDYCAKGRRAINILVRTGNEFEFKLAYLQCFSAMSSRYFPFKIFIKSRTFASEVVRSEVLILELRVVAYLLNERPCAIFAFVVSI